MIAVTTTANTPSKMPKTEKLNPYLRTHERCLRYGPINGQIQIHMAGCIYKVSHLHTRAERTGRSLAQIGAINFGFPTNDLKLTLN